eukprot:1189337-Prorocentrum_minimum.AAC.1
MNPPPQLPSSSGLAPCRPPPPGSPSLLCWRYSRVVYLFFRPTDGDSTPSDGDFTPSDGDFNSTPLTVTSPPLMVTSTPLMVPSVRVGAQDEAVGAGVHRHAAHADGRAGEVPFGEEGVVLELEVEREHDVQRLHRVLVHGDVQNVAHHLDVVPHAQVQRLCNRTSSKNKQINKVGQYVGGKEIR